MKDTIIGALLVLCTLGIRSCKGVTIDRAPWDSGDSGSGSGIGYQCPTDGCPVYCYANDDPHMRTFDGSAYEMQQEGKFFLYRHSTQPIWVQGFFQSCGYSGAFCSCGAAVRYYGETFIIDRCLRPNGVLANVVAKLGTGTSLQVNVYFAGYKISLPGALRVLLGSHRLGVGTITVQTNPADLTRIGGLCGYYDGYPSNDFTWRSGEITAAGTVYPYDFANSWRVPPSEDLFIGYNLDQLAPCIEVANSTFVPQGVADACFLNITPSDMLGSHRQFEPAAPFGLTRKRRQVGPEFPYGEWPAGWTATDAYSFCSDYLFASPAATACINNIPVSIDAGPFVESCARDIQLTGGTSFAAVALTALLSQCVATLEAYGISNNVIEENLCPFNCSGNGVCLSGACTCNQGWYGISCSQASNEVPTITGTSPSNNCPPSVNGTKCYAAYLYGGPFVNSGTLSISGLAYQASNPLQTRRVQVEIVYISPGVVIIRIRIAKCAWPRGAFVLVVSVSNDGVKYSSTVQIAYRP